MRNSKTVHPELSHFCQEEEYEWQPPSHLELKSRAQHIRIIPIPTPAESSKYLKSKRKGTNTQNKTTYGQIVEPLCPTANFCNLEFILTTPSIAYH